MRFNRDDSSVATTSGQRYLFDASGGVTQTPLAPSERVRFLVEEAGMSEELAVQVPADKEIPPSPWAQPQKATP